MTNDRPKLAAAVSAPPGPAAEDTAPARELAAVAGGLFQQVSAQVSTVVVGAEGVTEQLLIALLAGGHVLLEGVPGVAKTTISKVFAKLLGCEFQRVQFTPDLLPSDVTGTSILDRNKNDFVLRKGPIFCQVLLADEINRAPAKTQVRAARSHAGIPGDGGRANDPPATGPYMVMATQKPHRAGRRVPPARGTARPLPDSASRWDTPASSMK